MKDDFQKLVYARLQALPKGYTISIGGVGDVSKEDALKHVSENDKIGQLLIAVDRHYFDLVKNNEIHTAFKG